MKAFRVMRIMLTMLDIIYLIGILVVPALSGIKPSFWLWVIWGFLTLYILFAWLVVGRKRKSNDSDDKESQREAEISKELLSQRNKWHW